MTVSAVLTPVSMLLLFVYIFGGALGVALGAGGSYVGGLLAGTPIGNSGLLAVGWCLLLALAGYLWALSAYNRQPTR